MNSQILLNLCIAIIWMFMTGFSFSHFLFGYLIGTLLLFFFDRFIPDVFYLKRVWAIISLGLLFMKELVLANFNILKWVYKPRLDMKSGIFALPTDLTTHWEITLLANLITLTPGTLSVEVSYDNNFIFIHTIDLPNVEESVAEIKGTFEKAIMEVTR